MKPELKKLCGNLRGFSLKDKKLSRKGFRGVSRQVLSAFRRRIRWVYPGGLSFTIFLSRGLGFSRPSSWARTVLRPLWVTGGRCRSSPRVEVVPRVPRISPEAGHPHSPHFPLLPHFLPRACALPRDVLTPGSRPFLPRHRTTSSRRQKSGEELPVGSLFSAMSGHGFHGS